MRLVLASSSPRRRQLLAQLGVTFDMADTDVDERHRSGETPEDYVERLADTKSRSVGEPGDDELVTIGADTTVVAGGRILGKPRDPADAVDMLTELAGRTHRVITGVTVRRGVNHWPALVSTEVEITPMTTAEIAWYVASREPLDKAGAYAIQGIGGLFVSSIHGSYSNVVGLPLAETAGLLRRAGLSVPPIRSSG